MRTPPMLEPRQPASLAEPARPDPVIALTVLLVALAALGLLLGGILAVYTYATPGAEKPLFYGVLSLVLLALALNLTAATARQLRGRGR